MLYQLPTGKTISISFEQWLNMTDEDIQYLISINYGDTILSPFFRSSIKNPSKQKDVVEDDDSIDYIEESDETMTDQPRFVPLEDSEYEIPDSEIDLE